MRWTHSFFPRAVKKWTERDIISRNDLADPCRSLILRQEETRFIKRIALQGAETARLLSELREGRLFIIRAADAVEIVKGGC